MMGKKQPGWDLMMDLKRGDDSAFEKLVSRYQSMVTNFAYRYVDDQRTAEDIAQETFLRVFKARKRWRPEANFKTWLFTITTRLCLNEIRSAKRERRAFSTLEKERKHASGSAPPGSYNFTSTDKALENERAALVQKAVAELSDNQRTAVLLHRFEGLSYKEVASVMGLTLEAVRSLLVRARKNLRQRLFPVLGDRGSSD